MGAGQIVFGTILVLALVGLAGFYAQRQLLTLRRLREHGESPSEEDIYLRRQARRRLVNSVLMLLLAVLLVAVMVWGEGRAQALVDKRGAMPPEDRPPLTLDEKSFAYLYYAWLVTVMVILFVVVAIAAVDAWATRQYAARQYRKLMEDRREMIERQAARLRQERNGEEG
jgi:hypothetical protein